MKKELQLLQQASNEIKTLRKKNELMNARLDMFDSIMAILNTEIARKNKGMMHPDLVYEIDKLIEDNETK